MSNNNLGQDRKLVFETAQVHVCRLVPIVAPQSTALEIRNQLETIQYETVGEIAVCDEGRLVGLINIEDVLPAGATALATELMDDEPPVVLPGVDQEIAAWKAVQHDESCLAVVDKDGRFQGLIPPQRLLRVLLEEHDEDIAHFGGFLRDTRKARTASEESLPRRLWHRLPWLLIGLAGAILSAGIVGAFESQLANNVMLVFFIPGVIYLADAVGTQTETLVIRGLSLGVPLRSMVPREILTGVVIGISLAAIFLAFALHQWGNSRVCLAVSLALFAACSTATLVAMAIPWLFHQFGRDPAFASGPIGTVIQDLISILVYLLIAKSMVG
jgi:magnesium transporter